MAPFALSGYSASSAEVLNSRRRGPCFLCRSNQIIGLIAGAVVGFLTGLLIARERLAFWTTHCGDIDRRDWPYVAADDLQARSSCQFSYSAVIGNKDATGFKMESGEAQKLDEFVTTTAFIMRLSIFLLLGSQLDFGLTGQ
jgi:potassium/hydrogen antiporter